MTVTDPLAITEQAIPLPSGVEQVSLHAEICGLLERIAKLQNVLEEERRRVAKERRQDLLDLLEIADALDRLLSFTETLRNGEDVFERLYDGVRVTRKMFAQKLAKRGIQRMALTGQEVDPALAEILEVQRSDTVADDTVIEEIVVGYRLGDEILRPAKVVIARHR